MRLRKFTSRQGGFGLVEIMVGLVIGLLTTLVIMQIFSAFEGQKRSTTGSADAQTSGSVALFTITRDMQIAGYGLIPSTTSPLDCDPSPTTAAGSVVDLSPVVITDGADDASDTITIRFGNSPMGGVPTQIGAISGTTVTMSTNLGCSAGDIALIMNGASCQVRTATGLDANTGVVLDDVSGVLTGAQLACLGNWTQVIYQANAGTLMVDGAPRVSGIINLQAQYGISASADANQVEQWVNATGADWAAPSIANRNRIKAVRIAVVARNEQYERDELDSSAAICSDAGQPAWTSVDPVQSPAPSFRLVNLTDCQHYRYRIFETIVPLRNVVWSWDKL